MNSFYHTIGILRGCGALICLLGFGALTVRADDHFVRSSDTCTNTILQSPFTNWGMAATNIQWAVDVATAGDTVWVSNGVYTTDSPSFIPGAQTNYAVVLCSNKPINFKSVNGPAVTVIDGTHASKKLTGVEFYQGSSAQTITVSGFTIRNCWGIQGGNLAEGGGAMAYFASSFDTVVTNCIFYNNYAHREGGAIQFYLTGKAGYIFNCLIYSNTASSLFAGGISFHNSSASKIYNCIFWENNSGTYSLSSGGGAVSARNTPLEIKNSLFYKNNLLRVSAGINGGALRFFEGDKQCDLQNCTFVGNSTPGMGGGIYITSSVPLVARNLIIYDNYCTNGYPNIYLSDSSYTNNFTNCCIAPSVNYTFPVAQGNITNAPLLAGTNVDNYRLSANSPCLNTGNIQEWMRNAVDLDGHRRIDLLSGQVDIGCYEYPINGTIFIIR